MQYLSNINYFEMNNIYAYKLYLTSVRNRKQKPRTNVNFPNRSRGSTVRFWYTRIKMNTHKTEGIEAKKTHVRRTVVFTACESKPETFFIIVESTKEDDGDRKAKKTVTSQRLSPNGAKNRRSKTKSKLPSIVFTWRSN